MNTLAQQTALDNAWSLLMIDSGAPSPRSKILLRTSSSWTRKKCRVDVEVFCDILQICPRLPNQEFVEPPSSDEEIASFVKELGYKGDIESITKVYPDHMHQPWRTFNAIINRCLYGKTTYYVELLWEDFMFQIDYGNTSATRKENMPYLRFIKAIIHHFISKDKSISMRNKHFMHTVWDDTLLGSLKFVSKTEEYQAYRALIPEEMTNLKMQNSPAYKTYLAFTTGATTPKKARKIKKPAFLSKKKTLVAVEDPAKKPARKPVDRIQSAGVQIKDTHGVFMSKKKAPTKAERSKGIELLSEAALLEEAHDNDDDDDDDDEQGDDERTESKNDKIANLNKTDDDDEEGEFVHTPDDYVPTDDENVDDEEYDRINEEMYSDVNIELKDTELEGEGKDDEEMTDAGHVDAEHENVNQEVAGDQVKDDDLATVTVAPATQKTKVPLPSSSISSDHTTKFLNFDNIPSADTKIISMIDIKVQHEDPSIQTSPLITVLVSVIPESSTAPATTIPPPIPPFIPFPQQSTPIPTPTTTEATISTTVVPDSITLTAIHQRVSNLEKEVKIIKVINHDSVILAAIKYEVPTVVKEYIGTSLDDTLYKVIQKHTAELIKEHSVPADVVEMLQQHQKPQKSVADIRKIKMEQAGK
ncbi:hypothetical protein Tco_0034369 [Tanacetum coccineum]